MNINNQGLTGSNLNTIGSNSIDVSRLFKNRYSKNDCDYLIERFGYTVPKLLNSSDFLFTKVYKLEFIKTIETIFKNSDFKLSYDECLSHIKHWVFNILIEEGLEPIVSDSLLTYFLSFKVKALFNENNFYNKKNTSVFDIKTNYIYNVDKNITILDICGVLSPYDSKEILKFNLDMRRLYESIQYKHVENSTIKDFWGNSNNSHKSNPSDWAVDLGYSTNNFKNNFISYTGSELDNYYKKDDK